MEENNQNKEPLNKDFKVPNLRFKSFDDCWEKDKLDAIAEHYKGGCLSKEDISNDGTIPCILYGELYTTYLNKIENIVSRIKLRTNIIVANKGDVILPLSGETPLDISNSAVIPFDGVALGGDLIALRTSLNPLFLSYQLSGKRKLQIARLAQGKSVVHSNPNQLMKLLIFYPSKKEQDKIAQTVFCISKKIELIGRKVEALKKYKEGLVNLCFCDGKRYKVSSFVKQVEKRNKDNQILTVYSISNKKGFISQTEQFDGNEVASTNKANYKIVHKNEFAYNPARINVGSIAYLEEEIGQISPMYIVFSIHGISNILLDEYFHSIYFKKELRKHLEGSVRQSLSFENLCDFNINISNFSESFGLIFKSLNCKLSLLEKMLSDLKKIKSYLLENMFI